MKRLCIFIRVILLGRRVVPTHMWSYFVDEEIRRDAVASPSVTLYLYLPVPLSKSAEDVAHFSAAFVIESRLLPLRLWGLEPPRSFRTNVKTACSGVPSILRVMGMRFYPHFIGHPHFMISGLNGARRRTIHGITAFQRRTCLVTANKTARGIE